ncbi:MAG: hypothetical protein IT430_08520 [Phycisphaerales bacterium]|nr:hypothetical protein [Phycisphaerales bacterium]
MASGGNINGDGVNDILISSNLYDVTEQSPQTDVGRVYVFPLPDYATNGWPEEQIDCLASNERLSPYLGRSIILRVM